MLQQFATWKAAEGLRYPLLSHVAYSTLWDLQLSDNGLVRNISSESCSRQPSLTKPGRR